jgi:long-chain acyl-CoA synthetase
MDAPLIHLTDIVRRGAERHPDRLALQADGGVSFTYAELWERVQHGAGLLRDRGACAAEASARRRAAEGGRGLLVMEGRPEWAVAFFSLLQAGLVVIPVPAATPPELIGLVARVTGAEVCVLGGESAALESVLSVPPVTAAELVAASGRAIAAPSRGRFGDAGAPSRGRFGGAGAASAGGDTLAVLAFTSGSTARPRAVELTHENLLANVRTLGAAREAAPDDALLSLLPPAHLFELVVGLLAPLAAGARVVYAGTLLPNRVIDAIRRNRITRTLVVPAILDALGREAIEGLVARGAVAPACRALPATVIAKRLRDAGDCEVERIRRALRDRIGDAFHTVGIGGAAIASGWSETLLRLGIDLDVGYGLTEAGPLVSLGLASASPSGSVGRPLPGVEVRVDDRGEILVRSAGVMRGYFLDRAATAEALDDGWLRTGDRGRLDDEGFLFITGRLKEAIVTAAGETLYPDELEPHYASPLFAEHCVVPIRDADGNDVPTLVVVPSRGDATDEAIARVFARLRAAAPARCRVAAMLRRTEPIPRTAVGKPRRRALADALSAGVTGGSHGR